MYFAADAFRKTLHRLDGIGYRISDTKSEVSGQGCDCLLSHIGWDSDCYRPSSLGKTPLSAVGISSKVMTFLSAMTRFAIMRTSGPHIVK